MTEPSAIVEKVARLSAEFLSVMTKLMEVYLQRPDGLSVKDKLLTIQTASLEHAKALHIVIQSKFPEDKRISWSEFLVRLANAETEAEEIQKGDIGGKAAGDL